MSNSYKELLKKLGSFLNEKGWRKKICKICNKSFFSKNSEGFEKVCGWRECNENPEGFLNLPSKKKHCNVFEIKESIESFFKSENFQVVPSKKIQESVGKTDLIVAGVQIFDENIHGNQEVNKNKILLAQPCIRTQFQKQISSNEGFSTSFVNLCTEASGITFEDHLSFLDKWCTAFSKLGLHMKDFTLICRSSEKDWGTGFFPLFEIFFSYGGLEIGDASFFSIPRKSGELIVISDIGFGLERILWVTNKNTFYFDMFSPWMVNLEKEMLDSYRTLSLLALCGVSASNKGAGLQFRRFSKIVSENFFGANINYIVGHYYDYWKQFVAPAINKEGAIGLIKKEIERFITLKICEDLKLPLPKKEGLEEYLNRMMYIHKTDITSLRNAVKKWI